MKHTYSNGTHKDRSRQQRGPELSFPLPDIMAALEEELTCSACRDTFSHSHPLPCGHSFCPACIREAWGGHGYEGEGKGQFACPQCQEEGTAVLCDCCPGEQPSVATKLCLKCEVSLCAEHLQPHLERPAFRSHPLVDPLGDLSQRRCPTHAEMFRYYCADERVYVCGDCLLEGGHAQHSVKALKQVEDDLKVILQSLLQKTEEKLKEGEQILTEHQNIGCTMADSSEASDAQVKRLGSDLKLQVERLVVALEETTMRERHQAMERVHQDCSRVREDLTQTQSIQHYLASLLGENDPFLLIWAFQSDDTRLLADLNCPLFIPDPHGLDRKLILEDMENKYREFITQTLRCLSELKRELLSSPLSLDTNTAHPLLNISDDLRSAVRIKNRQSCPDHSDRFDHWPQVLTAQAFSCGTHYWELEAEGFWDIGVCYRSIGRKGKEGNAFGNNKVSWSLTQQHDRKLAAWHNRRKTRLSCQMAGNRVGVALDYSSGTITFSEVGPSGSLDHLHTFYTTFTQPVCLGFGLYKAELNSHVAILKV